MCKKKKFHNKKIFLIILIFNKKNLFFYLRYYFYFYLKYFCFLLVILPNWVLHFLVNIFSFHILIDNVKFGLDFLFFFEKVLDNGTYIINRICKDTAAYKHSKDACKNFKIILRQNIPVPYGDHGDSDKVKRPKILTSPFKIFNSCPL